MSETKEPELLPCPFCGGMAVLLNTEQYYGKPDLWYANCTQCGALSKAEELDDICDVWNRRVPVPQWTAEPPKEEGWYWIYIDKEMPIMASVTHIIEWRVCFNGYDWMLSKFTKKNPGARWLKIELPPLPERKENDE
jgi:Lar family restriction alleviation protein